MTSSNRLGGEVAFVMGASSGIGEAAARSLAAEGATVVVSARRENRLQKLADNLESEYEITSSVCSCDVRDEESVRSAIESTVDHYDRLDIVVSNAGVICGEGVESFQTENFDTVTETNVHGTFYLTKAAIPHLRAQGGCIIFIGSFDAKYPRSFNPVYAASKWWLRGYAHSIAGDVGTDDVAVSLINPSKVRTEIGSAYGEEFKQKFKPGEVLEPEHIAEAIRFAATRNGSAVSEMDVFIPDKYDREQF